MLAVERVVHDLIQPGPDLGLVAVADRLQEQVTKGLVVESDLAQHVEDLAPERLTLLLQLLQEPLVDLALASLLRDEIPEVADLGLADAVDAAEPLLDAGSGSRAGHS